MPQIRLLTWNLWHGLNPYEPIFMSPIQKPEHHAQRYRRQLELLKGFTRSPFQILCFQEVNPLSSRFQELESALSLKGGSCLVNSGIKLGGVGVPPGLEEGLGTVVGQGFSRVTFEEKTLSGQALEIGASKRRPLLSLQISERRKALLFEGELEGLRIAVINLHLHHGPDTVSKNLNRKRRELEQLREWIQPKLNSWDMAAVCGDFNCDVGSPSLEPLLEMGFRDASEIAGARAQPTWVPDENRFADESSQLAAGIDPLVKQWDAVAHVFDRVYLKTKLPISQIRTGQIKEPELSDHFGFTVEINL